MTVQCLQQLVDFRKQMTVLESKGNKKERK